MSLPESSGIDRTRIAFNGPIPTGYRRYANLPSHGVNSEFVYILSAADGACIYVGRAWAPARRLSAHCRKPWWVQVVNLTLIQVLGNSRAEAEVRTADIERDLIQKLAPSGNIAAGQRKLVPGGTH